MMVILIMLLLPDVHIGDIMYDAPGSDIENLNGEWVEIVNTGKEVDLNDFILMDKEGHKYYFPHFILKDSVRVHTGMGKNNDTDLFWGMKSPVWNNDGDVVILLYKGKVIDEKPYGDEVPIMRTGGKYIWGVSLSTIVIVIAMIITTLLRMRGEREDEDWDEFVEKGAGK